MNWNIYKGQGYEILKSCMPTSTLEATLLYYLQTVPFLTKYQIRMLMTISRYEL